MSACAASHAFPYVKKRIPIIYHHSENLSPIDFAVDEMSKKVTELNEVVYQTKPDLKQLQLKLQGCVSAQVRVVSAQVCVVSAQVRVCRQCAGACRQCPGCFVHGC